jgi:hypothetical protein
MSWDVFGAVGACLVLRLPVILPGTLLPGILPLLLVDLVVR